jgi:hypothetical protein
MVSFKDKDASMVLTQPLLLQGRKVERGVLQSPSHISLALLFERFPIWLLTLASNQVSHVVVMGFTTHGAFVLSCESKGLDMRLIDAALNNLG